MYTKEADSDAAKHKKMEQTVKTQRTKLYNVLVKSETQYQFQPYKIPRRREDGVYATGTVMVKEDILQW